jgi:tetratricopeptide (TPR) repeat protein
MYNFGSGFFVAAMMCATLLVTPPQTFAQQVNDSAVADTPETEAIKDEGIISYGTINLDQHDGLKAFFDGDFEKAEIEFENEFRSLKRYERGRENAVQDAALAADRALMMADGGVTAGASTRNGNPVLTPVFGNSSGAPNLIDKRGGGNTLLTDGKVTYEDFGFTRYMAGLSEIKLGKFEEARKSLETSLRYDESNFDARMRLGLLHVIDGDFEEAAKQLEKIDKKRRRCQRLACEDLETLNNAALELATQITRAVNAG